MGTIIHFEITADNMARARDFYRAVFGWKATPSPFVEGYDTVQTGDGTGIDGALMQRSYNPQPSIIWIQVEDIDATMARVHQVGGKADSPKNSISGKGFVTYVEDSEGNVIGLTQPF